MNKKLIECETIFGEKIQVTQDKLIFRPAAYGIVVEDSKILLVNTKSTNKWFFPGGSCEIGEKIEECLKREILEETGVGINEIKFFTFKESFFYYKPHNKAYHCFNIFFIVVPDRHSTSQKIHNDPSDEADKYDWIDIASLKPGNMQSFASEILERYKSSI